MARLRRTSPTPTPGSSVFDGSFADTPASRSRHNALSPSPSASSDKENQATPGVKSTRGGEKGKGPMAPPPRPGLEQRGSKRRRLSEQRSMSVASDSTFTVDADADPERDDTFTMEAEIHTDREETESLYAHPDQRYFDPEQDEDERRLVRQGMRENIREFNDHRDELIADNGEKLIRFVKKQNVYMEKVRQTVDATIDSGFLVAASELAVKKAKADGDTSAGVDVDEFVSKCIAFMQNGAETQRASGSTGRRQSQGTQRAHVDADNSDDDEDDGIDGDALAWHVLGAQACFPCTRRPAVPSFLLGPLGMQKRARQLREPRTQRRTQLNAATQQPASRPQELRAEDLQAAENSNLTQLVRRIWSRLKSVQESAEQVIERATDDADARGQPLGDKELRDLCRRVHVRRAREDGQPGVPLFEFVLNPHHFGQSVENAFYVSFLIKEGRAAVLADEDGLPILRCILEVRTNEERRGDNSSRRQAVISLDHARWRELVDVFDIREPLIPHREEENAGQRAVGASGWYG